MQKKLTEEKLAEILDIGIAEFAEQGPDRANINVAAKKAGVSVGVLYKYYGSKEGFFQACLRRSLDLLDTALRLVTDREESLLSYAESLIRAVQRYARSHESDMKLYLQLTLAGGERASLLAAEIEGVTARLYPRFLSAAQQEGKLRRDADPAMFAFFFDNLLTMLQFSYCCDYHRARFRLFCGGDILEQDERVAAELLKFLESAFTTERSDIPHGAEEGAAP